MASSEAIFANARPPGFLYPAATVVCVRIIAFDLDGFILISHLILLIAFVGIGHSVSKTFSAVSPELSSAKPWRSGMISPVT
jgi:hypothetical protein